MGDERLYMTVSKLPAELQKDLKKVNKLIANTLHAKLKEEEYKSIRALKEYKGYAKQFAKRLDVTKDKNVVQIWPEGDKHECMIQITGHFKYSGGGSTRELLHKLIGDIYKELKPVIQKDYNLRLDYEYTDENLMEGFDVYTSNDIAKVLYMKLNNIIKENHIDDFYNMDIFRESGLDSSTKVSIKLIETPNDNKPFLESTKDNSPETGNKKLQPSHAEQTLLTLAKSVIIGNGKVSDYTVRTISNIISNNLLSEWAPDFKKVNIKLLPDHTKLDLEFIPPKFISDKDNTFIKKFLNGTKTLSSFLKTNNTIDINVSSRLFKTLTNPEDVVECFKNAIKYYDIGIDKGANNIATSFMSLNTPTKELLYNELSGLVVYPLSLLFVFQDINNGSNKTFESDMKLIESLNSSIKSIVGYIDPRKNNSKTKLDNNLNNINRVVDEISKNVTYTDNIKLLKSLPGEISKLYKGKFDNVIKESVARFESEQCASYGDAIIIFNEAVRPKRLKKIPNDLIPYIMIEGEAVKDANDKMIIVSYAFSKLEIIDWYIELLEVGSRNYIVPHTKSQLEGIRVQLIAAIKKIMDTPVPKLDRPIIDIKYPKGYEG